jgi:hypothetical protein
MRGRRERREEREEGGEKEEREERRNLLKEREGWSGRGDLSRSMWWRSSTFSSSTATIRNSCL